MPPKRAPRAPKIKRTNTIASVSPYLQNAQRFFQQPGVSQLPPELRVSQYAIRRRQATRDAVDTYRRAMNDTVETSPPSATRNDSIRFDTTTVADFWGGIRGGDFDFDDTLMQYVFAMLNQSITTNPTVTTNERGAYTRRMQLRFEVRLSELADNGNPDILRNSQTPFFDATTDYGELRQTALRIIQQLKDAMEEYQYAVDEVVLSVRVEDFAPNVDNMNANGCIEAQRIGNATWFCPDTEADLNCLWNACVMARNTTMAQVENYISKHGKKKEAWKEASKYLKRKYINTLSAKEQKTSGGESVQAVANGERRNIDVYNDRFMLLKTYTPTLKPTKPPMSLMLSKNHFIAMLPNALRPDYLSDRVTFFGETKKTDGFFQSSIKPTLDINTVVANLKRERDEEAVAEKKRMPYSKMYDKPREFVEGTFSTYDFESCHDRKLENGESSNWIPYACGINTPRTGYKEFWGVDCPKQLLDHLWAIRHEEFRVNSDRFENKLTHAIYAHNGGRFDMYFLLRTLLTTEPEHETWRIAPDQIINNGNYLRVTLYDPADEAIRVNFQDSMAYMAMPLKQLAKEYQCDTQKGEFDHDRVTVDNFMDFQDECSVYLKADVMSLFEVLKKHERYVWDFSYSKKEVFLCQHDVFKPQCKGCKDTSRRVYGHEKGGIMMTQVITASSISKRTFQNKYYNFKHAPFYTPTVSEFNYIKRSYLGGRNETFVPVGMQFYMKVFYKDFTSLYPFIAATNDLPCGEMVFKELGNVRGTVDNLPYGFVRCMVRSIDFKRKALHCYKEKGKCFYSYFVEPIEMTLFSEEIRLGMTERLYEYTLVDAITFGQKAPFLRGIMTDAFNVKKEQSELGNSGRASAAKIVANSAYGFWGMNTFNKEGGKIEHAEVTKIDKAFSEQRVLDVNRHGDYVVSKQIADIPSKDINVGVASAITSLARMHLWKLMDAIESQGGTVFYCDTDSVITNIDTDKNEVLRARFNPSGTGKELGELKCEIYDKLKKGGYCEQGDISTVGNWMDGLCVGGLKAYGMTKNHPLMYRPMDIATQKGGNKTCHSDEYFHAGLITVKDGANSTIDVPGTKIMQNRWIRGGITALLEDTANVFQMRFDKGVPKNIRFQYAKAKLSTCGLKLLPFVWTQSEGFH